MSREDLLQRARNIRLAVFDVDGVLTDGRLYLSDSGEQIKAFHTRDGLGLKALMNQAIEVAVITARESQVVVRRVRELGIPHLIQGCDDKAEALQQMLDSTGLSAEVACFTGDDLVDWPAMRQCALRFAPADASPWIRARVDLVTAQPGGRGAVREICELLLEARGALGDWQRSYE
ncbi:MAG: HAD family hydrolase [Pseudomonadota bacterium]|nr:MAG: HAD family hydrolase [Pseudomonadota bacterium]